LIGLPALANSDGVQDAQTVGPTIRAGYDDVPEFGGPGSVGATLKEDDKPAEPVMRFNSIKRGLSPYFDWKANLKSKHGLSFGMDYTGLYEHATKSPGEDNAASGIFRLFGNWTLTGRGSANTGSLVFKVESRHRLGTTIPPSGLGFETGYVGLTAAPYNDAGWWLSNFYWQQKLNDGRMTLLLGQVDATDYIDIYGLINPWTAFTNLVFLTGSGTMPAPNQSLGGALGAMLSDNVYLIAGIADSNGDPHDPLEGFNTLFDEGETFKHVELGWTTAQDRIYLDNYHVTVWQADERTTAGTPGGWGMNASFAKFVNDEYMPFLRAGYSDDGGALLENSISAGVGRYFREHSDLFAAAVNWGKPSDDFGANLDDQYTLEVFYRFQLSENFAITPDFQWIIDPALNPAESSLAILGVRARLSI